MSSYGSIKESEWTEITKKSKHSKKSANRSVRHDVHPSVKARWEADFSQNRAKKSAKVTMSYQACVCKGVVCSKGKGPTCMPIMPPGPVENSGKNAIVFVFGETVACQKWADQYNNSMPSVESFCNTIRTNMTSKDPLDRAFRMIVLDFAQMFGGKSLEELNESFGDQLRFRDLRNEVLSNIVTKFLQDQTCGKKLYEDVHTEFSKVNKGACGELQAQPCFSMSYEIAGNPYIPATSNNIVEKKDVCEGVRMFMIPKEEPISDKFDKGYLEVLANRLYSDLSKSVVLQFMIPDGRWLVEKRGRTNYVRYSDEQFTPFKGKIHKGEKGVSAAAREMREETGYDLPEESFIKMPNNPWPKHPAFAVDVSKVMEIKQDVKMWV